MISHGDESSKYFKFSAYSKKIKYLRVYTIYILHYWSPYLHISTRAARPSYALIYPVLMTCNTPQSLRTWVLDNRGVTVLILVLVVWVEAEVLVISISSGGGMESLINWNNRIQPMGGPVSTFNDDMGNYYRSRSTDSSRRAEVPLLLPSSTHLLA